MPSFKEEYEASILTQAKWTAKDILSWFVDEHEDITDALKTLTAAFLGIIILVLFPIGLPIIGYLRRKNFRKRWAKEYAAMKARENKTAPSSSD